MRPIASALGGIGAVLFSMIFELVIKYFTESLALANNMDTLTAGTIVTVSPHYYDE